MTLADLQLGRRDAIVIAHLSGEIDMSNARELADAVMKATTNDAAGVLLDLTAVDYLDSAGIHLLYRLRESLRSRGQTMRLVIPRTSPVTDALRLAGVGGHIDIVENVEEAFG